MERSTFVASNIYSLRELVEVEDFQLPCNDSLPSFLCPEILPVPDLFEVVDSVPTSDANVYDARIRPFNSRSYASRSYVSVVVLRDPKDAFALERTMHEVAAITGKDCVLGTKLIVNRNPAVETGSPHHCLITDRIPEQTVAMFLAEKPPLNVKRQFFKLLWSALSKLHEAGTFFGNLASGLRVLKNKPILTFPAKKLFLGGEYVIGVQNDLVNVITWAIEAFPELVIELKCFLSICRDVVPVRNSVVARTGSYLVLHHNLVWSPDDCIRYCMRMQEYFMLDPAIYCKHVDDGAIHELPFSSLGLDWKFILDQPAAVGSNSMLLADSRYRDGCRSRADGSNGVYHHSERLRYFIRCKMCHLHSYGKLDTSEKMIDAILDVFPEAMSRLYYMAYRRFHFSAWLSHFQYLPELPARYVDFFKCTRGCPNSFQF